MLNPILDSLQQKFKVAWAILTLLLILFVGYYQWEHLEYEQTSRLQLQASNLGYKIDNFIDSIFKSIDLLPLDETQKQACQNFLMPQLQSIVFNNPLIDGIVVYYNRSKSICTTFDPKASLPNPYIQQPVLLGPMKTEQVNKDFFLLQQPYKNFYVGFYLLKSSLEFIIHIDDLNFKSIYLYDTREKQIILASRPFSNDQDIHSFDNMNNKKKNEILNLPLESVKNINLVINTSEANFKSKLLIRLLLTTLPILFLSWILHRYFQQTMTKHFSIITALNDALKLQQFYPVYQPIFCIKTKQFYGAEVLIRWLNNNELIMPDNFIKEAEFSGLIVPITLQLIEKSLAECAPLLAKNPNFHLGFNLCPAHFKSEAFFNDFEILCNYYNVLPQQIMLELTERELFSEHEIKVINQMKELRSKGYSLAIDDFGTGHASINYLQHFPFNYLKIDKIFIQSIGTGAITETLNDAIINMANTLKLKIIAEGVETEQQFNYLTLKNVSFLQGWFIAKAMNIKQLQELLINTGKQHE
ncbi:Rtn protein [Legionella busanensis]|uniref:Rtn protein n=1 Tax=Legionella busanensis TaxID=190655 RepID=A0A378JKW3_9GAMM|nr:EAL domain-containing protein [Legionella busanensis]STX51371.1 Rtn protein [Legionella busanensis]